MNKYPVNNPRLARKRVRNLKAEMNFRTPNWAFFRVSRISRFNSFSVVLGL